METASINIAAEKLSGLYLSSFGGKSKGRYRISRKLATTICGRRRLFEDDVRDLSRSLFNLGFVLIDMDSFFVVMSVNTFTNYRRVNEDCI